MQRNNTRQIHIGSVAVGGGAPVSIQSMTNTETADAVSTLKQIRALADAGCQIARLAVPAMQAAETLPDILKDSPLPLVADIHFDYHLALASIKAGIHAVRINPGNIGSPEKVRKVVEAAGNAGIPIRVGANTGSLPKGLLAKLESAGLSHEQALAEALCIAALEQAAILEECGFHDIKLSVKSSSVPVTVAACRKIAERCDYPLHIGITEAGTKNMGTVKSAVGLGTLLLEGIGDTMRVSLTGDPVEEIYAAQAILEAAGLREALPYFVSCPTCGRTGYDMIPFAEQIENYIRGKKAAGCRFRIRKIAVMGCAVNGPGEASDADLGIAGGPPGKLIFFRNGEITETIPESEGLARMKAEIDKCC